MRNSIGFFGILFILNLLTTHVWAAPSPVLLRANPPLTLVSGLLSCPTASGSQAGCLSSADWTKFNNGAGGSGTVTSVATSVTSMPWLTIGGGTITTSGTFAFSPTTGQTQNEFLATPSGSSGAVGLRTIVSADIPTLNQNTTGTAAGLSVTLAIGSGGTGQTTTSTAFNALSPFTTLGDTLYGGASGAGTRLAGNTTSTKKFKTQTGDGTNSAAPVWSTIATGDVPTLNQNTTGTAAGLSVTLAIASGGTNATSAASAFNNLSPLTTLGDLLYGGASGAGTRLAGDTSNAKKFLITQSSGGVATAPQWGAIVGADLPNPSASTLGGIESITSLSHNWIAYIDTSGVPHQSQPAFTDLSGTLGSGQMPTFTGDVTNSALAMTVAKIAGVAVGTPTGTTNVVFSDSPTFTTKITVPAVVTSLVEEFSPGMPSVVNTTQPLDAAAAYAYTVNTAICQTSSGTVTVDLKIGSTGITGCTGISVSATPSTATCTAANSVSIGNTFNFITSSNSSGANLACTIKTTRN